MKTTEQRTIWVPPKLWKQVIRAVKRGDYAVANHSQLVCRALEELFKKGGDN